MPLAGCFGGDDDDSSDAPDEELSDWNVHFAATAADLPTCNDDTNGRLYYVEADSQFQVCKVAGWEVIAIQGADGAVGAAGADGQDGSDGAPGVDGIDGVDMVPPSNGWELNPGVDENEYAPAPTLEVYSGGNDYVIVIGAGSDEWNGQYDRVEDECGFRGNGCRNNYQMGDTSKHLFTNEGGYWYLDEVNVASPYRVPIEDGLNEILIVTIQSTSCSNGGSAFGIGEDLDGNGFLDSVEIMSTIEICNGVDGLNGQDGANGNDGADGTNGQDGAPGVDGNDGVDGQDGDKGDKGDTGDTGMQGPMGPPGANGQDGADGTNGQDGAPGAKGDSGADGNDGVDGQDGAPGAPGADGTNGQDGHSVLISTSTEPAGTNCANGGVRIDAGTDDNDDGTLDANEVYSTQYICDGGSSASTMLTSASTLPSAMVCNGGGTVISHGLDNGDGGGNVANGQLESGEVDHSITYCNSKGTVMEYDCVVCWSGDSYPNEMVTMGSDIFMQYIGSGNPLNFELYKYDTTMPGSASNPSLVKNMNGGSHSNPQDLTAVGNSFFFKARAQDAVGNFLGYELWMSDGTTSGTVLVKDIAPGSPGGMDGAPYFTEDWNGTVVFFAADDDVHGKELWVSDGTAAGTVMVADINPNGDSSPAYLTIFNNELYFRANGGTNGHELWKYDGTTTSMVADINTGFTSSTPKDLTVFNNELYFQAYKPSNGGFELWKYDGTTASMVADINPSGDSFPEELTVFNNELYFRADDGTHGGELWKYDGTTASMVVDFNPSAGFPENLIATSNLLYFIVDDGVHGAELWKYDGVSNPMMVMDIDPSSGASGIVYTDQKMAIVGDVLYFSADDGVNGIDLWATDGTEFSQTVVTYS